MAFPINQDQIFAATNGGLDIITRFIDGVDSNKHFKIRKEGTESANMSKKDGIYFVRDWGDVGGFFEKSRHAIHIYSHYTGKTYFESLLDLGRELGLVDDKNTAVKNITSCKFYQFQGELNDQGFCYETKDFTDYELEILGPLVTPELCRKYGLYSLKSYSWMKSDDLQQKEMCTVYTVESSELYPIMAFIVTDGKSKLSVKGDQVGDKVEVEKAETMWLKIYQPKSHDKKYRFSYLGKKPKQYIFGLDQLKSTYNKIQETDESNTAEDGTLLKFKKLERVVICSGDRDSINMASTGETVVWFNSETAEVTESQIGLLFKYSNEVINVPDLDPTGYDAGQKLALNHLDVKTAWLPDSLTKKKDFRGNPLKDFTDYIKSLTSYDDKEQKELKIKIKRFIELARPAKFWYKKQRINREGKPIGDVTYMINYKNAFNFLKLNGFARVKDEYHKDGYYFIKQEKHVIRKTTAQEIKDFFNQFLDKKQKEHGLKLFPDELLNMLIGSEAVSDKKLVNLESKDFDLIDFTPKSQYFFFDKFIWHVTKDKIEEITKGYSRYVMEEDILNNIIKEKAKVDLDSSKVKILDKFFVIDKGEDGNWILDIKKKDCDFMNYLISASRVHWKSELDDLDSHEWEEYLNSHKFIINSRKLTEDQIYEQELHLINKIYAIGYMLHRYKDDSKSWCLYAMDNEVVDDSQSHGRSGKSLLTNRALRLFMNSKYIPGRKKKIIESEFIYDGITRETDYVLFDDVNKSFRFDDLFTDITGDLHVNPKSVSPFIIPSHESPKFAITTNFAPVNLDTSTLGRILFIAFSDWYHIKNEKYGTREIPDDFGRLFFTGWDAEQWNYFLNFMMQCLQFFLSCKQKVEAPYGNIKKRNLAAEIGPAFMDWADEYFTPERMNTMIIKKEAIEHLHASSKYLSGISVNLFKTRITQYCELKGYIFNPKEEQGKDGRVIKWDKDTRKSIECIYIKAPINQEELPEEMRMQLFENENDNPYD